MALANDKVVRVMAWRDFYAAGSKLLVYVRVSNNRNLPTYQRQDQVLTHNVAVTVIFRMDSNRKVAQHRLRSGRGDGNKLVAILHRILDMPYVAMHILVFNLRIGDRRSTGRTPVDDSIASINQPFLI